MPPSFPTGYLLKRKWKRSERLSCGTSLSMLHQWLLMKSSVMCFSTAVMILAHNPSSSMLVIWNRASISKAMTTSRYTLRLFIYHILFPVCIKKFRREKREYVWIGMTGGMAKYWIIPRVGDKELPRVGH